ncbi:hypothetical protein GCM10028784_38670 [Myceligenerans cantabricum]
MPSRSTATGIALITVAACLLWPTNLAVASDRDYTFIRGGAAGQEVNVEAFRDTPTQPAPPSSSEDSPANNQPAVAPPSTPSSPGRGEPVDPNTRHWRATPELCQFSDLPSAASALRAECEDDGQRRPYEGADCTGDQEVQNALFEQRRTGDGWTEPEVVEEESCVDPAGRAAAQQAQGQQRRQVDIPAAAARAFRNMAIEPSDLKVQPPNGWTLVNLDTIAYAEDEPRVLDTSLFGIPVSIRAVPDTYTWSWGDGAADKGTDPGAPYPDHTVAHAYVTPGEATITLTTTWRGQFRLPGDPAWRDVPGQATTDSSSPPIEIREARTRLVEDLSY